MKKIGFIGFLCFFGIMLNAQKIIKLEYYVDNDPGIGLATSIVSSNSDSINQILNIPIVGKSLGVHKLFIRTLNDSGKWSIAQPRLFYIEDSVSYKPLTMAEYYIDNDPGVGKASNIGIVKSDSSLLTQPISITGIQTGIHLINIRYKDFTNQWNISTQRLFVVRDSLPISQINGYEYYVDNDPGQGKAQIQSITPDDTSLNNVTVNIGNLSAGIHKFNFRFKDNLYRWTSSETRFFVVNEKDSAFKINEAEYFYGSDPGVGNATKATSFSAVDSLLRNETFNSSGLKEGIHNVSIRFKNNLNLWGMTQKRVLFVEKDTFIQNNVISRGEYFIDNDPGFHSATALPLTKLDSVQTQLNYLVLPLTLGKHILGIRYKDTLHRWSTTKYIPFEVKRPVSDFSYTVNSATKLVAFTNNTFGTNYFWDFGDLSNSTSQSPNHQYIKSGIYNVCLAVYGNKFEVLADTCKRVAVSDTTYSSFKYISGAGNNIKFSNTSSLNINKFYWTFSDGTYDTTANPSHTFPKAGVYNVCLKVVNKAGTQTVDTCKSVKVGIGGCNVKSSFSYLIYQGDSIMLFNQRSNLNGGYFSWNFGDGTTSTSPNPQKKYKRPGFYLVSLTVSDSSRQCIDYFSDVVKVGLSECKAAYSYFVNAATKEITFINNSVGTNLKYYWSFNDGSSSIIANPTHSFGKDGLFNVSLTVTNNGGTCSDVVVQTIQLGKVDCNAEFSFIVDSVNNIAYFSNKTSTTTSKNLWTFGDGTFSTLTNPSHKYSAPGYYTIGLSVFNTLGCIDYVEEVILIGREGIDCESDFVYNVENRTVSFFNKSKGDINRYVWNLGDGSVLGTTENISHIYTKDGFFNVCLTIINKIGIQNITCKRLAVGTNDALNCLADFNYSIDSVTNTVIFKPDWVGKFDKFEWDFGDKSAKAIVKDPAPHKYNQPGYYLVGCALKNSTNGCKSKIYKTIDLTNVNTKKLKAQFGYDPQNYDLKAGGYPVDFIGTGIGDHAKLRWDFGDGSVDTTSPTPEHIYSVPKNYKVCYTVTDQVSNTTDTYCDSVRTNLLCSTDFEPPVANCKDITLKLDANGMASLTPQMINNGSKDDCTLKELILIGKNSYDIKDVGIHNVKLVAMDGLGNTDTSTSKVTVVLGTNVDKSITVDDLIVIPNPFTDQVLIQYLTSKSAEVSINIFDQAGKLVDQIVRTKKVAGNYQFIYATSHLKVGVYIFVISTDYGIEKRQLLIKQ